jgi:nucleotide-binding universal stress UspA family protein
MTRVDTDTIVVGVDASECSDAAVDWAAEEARRSGRRVLLVGVWHWSSSVVGSPMSMLGGNDPYTAGRHILKQSAARARARGVPVHTWLVEGSPARALADISTGAAMLVVGSHGHGVIRRSLLGSVSEGALGQAQCPVVILPSRMTASSSIPGGAAGTSATGGTSATDSTSATDRTSATDGTADTSDPVAVGRQG